VTRIPRGAVQLQWRRQRQEKARRWPTLNLVALMDVFTILVFFFLVHSVNGGPEADRGLVKLPESVADEPPRETPVVTITAADILLGGEPIVAVGAAMGGGHGEIEPLTRALQAQPGGDVAVADSEREITISGDRSIPFALLNRVMLTCKRAGYGGISLSVLQRASGEG
jgi:biopolymer transport protein ExbD